MNSKKSVHLEEKKVGIIPLYMYTVATSFSDTLTYPRFQWCSDEVEHGLGTVVNLSVFVSTLTISLTYFLNQCTYLAPLADDQ